MEAQTPVPIVVSSKVPGELNPDGGGAPSATPEQAAAFAWQEFIALNWPAGPQEGKPNQRDTPSTELKFGDPKATGPLVWETFRGKAEIFPGSGSPPGYPGNNDPSLGYDALPQYNYTKPIPPADPNQANEPTPWINLDETDEITLASMYAGVVKPDSSPGNSSPQLIRFLAKANRSQYVYVAGNSSSTDTGNQWWNTIPSNVVAATKQYLAANQKSPPPGSTNLVSLPDGTIEMKAAWRPLNADEIASGRFHIQKARFYEGDTHNPSYRNAVWGLVALHIIQKTPTAPYFIYATFEQADNILTADGKPVEDENGNIIPQNEPGTATTPQVCLVDPQPPLIQSQDERGSINGSVILTDDPRIGKPAAMPSYCGAGSKLYYHNERSGTSTNVPADGDICVDKRDNAIPDYAIKANTQAHAAIADYLKQLAIKSAPWSYYKLINVQYFPYDKVITQVMPNGSLYTASPPFTAQHPAPSSFYQANIVVETSRSLQLFSGGLSLASRKITSISTDWNRDGTPHTNTYYGGHGYNMGGCMGCHGSQGQNPASLAGDFSVILARGAVNLPEVPALQTSQGMTEVLRNRSLSK
jgi:hypothetical protein